MRCSPLGYAVCTLFAALIAFAPLAMPAGALACPEAAPPPLRAVFTADGAVARSGDAIVDFRGDSPVTTHAGLGRSSVAVSPDGNQLVTATAVHVPADGVPPCTPTHLWVRIGAIGGDQGSAEGQRIARLQGETVGAIRFSSSGRFVALAVHGGRRDDESLGADRVHIFDLRSRRRRFVLEGTEVTFLDDRHFVLRDGRSRLALHGTSDGERVRVLAPPARRLRPFAEGANGDGFFATARMEGVTRFVRARLVRGQLRLEPIGPALTERPRSISDDGTRGASISEGRAIVRDLTSGDDLVSFGTDADEPARDDRVPRRGSLSRRVPGSIAHAVAVSVLAIIAPVHHSYALPNSSPSGKNTR